MILQSPTIPEKEGEVYHIVAMEWFEKWKKYTSYNSIKLLEDTTSSI
jgi:hypothetical protein